MIITLFETRLPISPIKAVLWYTVPEKLPLTPLRYKYVEYYRYYNKITLIYSLIHDCIGICVQYQTLWSWLEDGGRSYLSCSREEMIYKSDSEEFLDWTTNNFGRSASRPVNLHYVHYARFKHTCSGVQNRSTPLNIHHLLTSNNR